MQTIADVAGVGDRLVAGFLPGKFAAHDRNRALVRPDRLRAAATRRVLSLRTDLNEPHRPRLVADSSAAGALYKARPALAGPERLPEAEHIAAARVHDRIQAHGTHGFGSRREAGLQLCMAGYRQRDSQSSNRYSVHPHHRLLLGD